MGLTSVELLIDVSPMRISYSGNIIAYGYTDSLSAKIKNILDINHIVRFVNFDLGILIPVLLPAVCFAGA